MKHETPSINHEEYGSLLQQALEQIRTARIVVAKYINNATQSVYWNLGKLLFESIRPSKYIFFDKKGLFSFEAKR